MRDIGSRLTFKACLISRIDLAIGTDFSGLADHPAENPAWMLAYALSCSGVVCSHREKGRGTEGRDVI